ncbi:Chromodomain-Helicase-Dna-Binding Protein 8 [Manis pentadactyla]|nr:Chromodomain-Helicase-Dna-Binding Protein 8 [Manis pentadactyla]
METLEEIKMKTKINTRFVRLSVASKWCFRDACHMILHDLDELCKKHKPALCACVWRRAG